MLLEKAIKFDATNKDDDNLRYIADAHWFGYGNRCY